jgi:uncharacterized protein YdaU (DUF1376 family)
MSAAPFMQLYVGDYLADTLDLTTEQHGAYLLLLMAMWRADGSLPNDPQKLARFARVHPPRWAKVWAEIARFFVEADGRITNERLTKEREKAVHKSNSRAASGSLGGRAKALKSKDTDVANATVLPKHGQISEPDTDKKDREPIGSLALVAPEIPSRFSEFWDQYPHRNGAKKGKAKAEQAWAKAIKARASPDQIIAGAMRYAGDRQVIEGYAKDPATWLNAKGWEDEIERSDNRPRSSPSRAESGTVAAFAAIAARRTAGSGGY